MAGFNRFFVILVALAWCAAIGLALWLVWDQSRFLEINDGGLEFRLDATLEQAEQILATIILVALALPAAAIMLMEMRPSQPRDGPAQTDRIEHLQSRVDTLERQLRQQPAPTAAVASDDRRDEMPPPSQSRRWRLPLASRH
jgi:hypothetical protein